jgi:hypothetical protein
MKKAILINSLQRTITEVTIDDWQDIAKHLDCGVFTTFHDFENGDTFYADDEGLYRDDDAGACLINIGSITAPYDYPIAGHVLVLGCDVETGESADVQSSLEDIKKRVTFINRKFLNF